MRKARGGGGRVVIAGSLECITTAGNAGRLVTLPSIGGRRVGWCVRCCVTGKASRNGVTRCVRGCVAGPWVCGCLCLGLSIATVHDLSLSSYPVPRSFFLSSLAYVFICFISSSLSVSHVFSVPFAPFIFSPLPHTFYPLFTNPPSPHTPMSGDGGGLGYNRGQAAVMTLCAHGVMARQAIARRWMLMLAMWLVLSAQTLS